MPKRRLNQEGSLTHRKDGRWMARVSHEGQRVTVYGKTKEEARQKMKALKSRQDQGLLLVSSQMLLKDYLPLWLEEIQYDVRPKTLADYSDLVRCHIIPRLGHIRLAKLSREDVQRAWGNMLSEGHSASVVEHCHLRLSKALNDAMERKDNEGRELLSRNPCRKLPHPKSAHKEMNPPGADEINQMLEAAKETEYYEAIYTSYYTGLRRGELLALRWRDVDLNLGTISVNHSLYRARGASRSSWTPRLPRAADW